MSQSVTVQDQARISGRRRRLAWYLGAGVMLAGGAVYGSVRLYQEYIVKVNVNGVEHVKIIKSMPDGTALVEVPTPGGGTARILVGPENIGPDGVIHAGITISDQAGKKEEKR